MPEIKQLSESKKKLEMATAIKNEIYRLAENTITQHDVTKLQEIKGNLTHEKSEDIKNVIHRASKEIITFYFKETKEVISCKIDLVNCSITSFKKQIFEKKGITIPKFGDWEDDLVIQEKLLKSKKGSTLYFSAEGEVGHIG